MLDLIGLAARMNIGYKPFVGLLIYAAYNGYWCRDLDKCCSSPGLSVSTDLSLGLGLIHSQCKCRLESQIGRFANSLERFVYQS